MKMKGRKATVYIVNTIIFTTIMILSIIFNTEICESAVIGCISGLLLTSFMFIGGNIWKDWIRSKYYRDELNNH